MWPADLKSGHRIVPCRGSAGVLAWRQIMKVELHEYARLAGLTPQNCLSYVFALRVFKVDHGFRSTAAATTDRTKIGEKARKVWKGVSWPPQRDTSQSLARSFA
jgi:hypothetical protein